MKCPTCKRKLVGVLEGGGWQDCGCPEVDDENLPPIDVCCCGDSMEGHESALSCGHSPKSMRAYALEIKHTGGKGFK